MQTLLDDLSTLTEFAPEEWIMRYEGKNHEWSEKTFAELVPQTPDAYRANHEDDLNSMRAAAGIDHKNVHKPGEDVKALQSAAGIR